MVPDRPLYEEMVRRGSRGRLLWLLGRWLNLAGLFGIVLALAAWPVVLLVKLPGGGKAAGFAVLALAALYSLGFYLKRLSYRIAWSEGIDVAKFLGQEGAGQDPARRP